MRVTGMHVLAALMISGTPAYAQTTSKTAEYLATVKAVADFKINDENTEREVERLRQNKYFLNKLQRRLSKLKNSKTSDSTNRKVIKILEDAGKQLERTLD